MNCYLGPAQAHAPLELGTNAASRQATPQKHEEGSNLDTYPVALFFPPLLPLNKTRSVGCADSTPHMSHYPQPAAWQELHLLLHDGVNHDWIVLPR